MNVGGIWGATIWRKISAQAYGNERRFSVLASGVLLLLSGVTWGVIVFFLTWASLFICILPGPFWSLATPWAWLPTGLIVGGVGGFLTHFALRRLLVSRTRTWVITSAIGLAIGLVLGVLLAWDQSPQRTAMPGAPYETWLGWGSYFVPLLFFGATGLGAAQWIVLRRTIRFTLWLVPVAAFVGAVSGAWLGMHTDDVIIGYGLTTDGLGERLIGALLTGFPVAVGIIGVLWGAALCVALIQHQLLQRG